jgi:hypothetical protein
LKQRLTISVVLLALVVPVGVATYFYLLRRAHLRVFDRAMLVIHRNDLAPPSNETLSTWRVHLAGPHNIMHNFFVSPDQFRTEELRTAVFHFETLWPEGLKSVGDTQEMIEELKKLNPSASDYIRRWSTTATEFSVKVHNPPNKSVQPTPGSVTPRASAGTSK